MNDCWNWPGLTINSGYGRTTEHELAHRAIWRLYNGVLSANIFVLHKCDNKLCVNPNHLFLGNHNDNMKDMCFKKRDKNSKKTHCKNGHEFNQMNTYLQKNRRQCRVCQLFRQRKWYSINKKYNGERV